MTSSDACEVDSSSSLDSGRAGNDRVLPEATLPPSDESSDASRLRRFTPESGWWPNGDRPEDWESSEWDDDDAVVLFDALVSDLPVVWLLMSSLLLLLLPLLFKRIVLLIMRSLVVFALLLIRGSDTSKCLGSSLVLIKVILTSSGLLTLLSLLFLVKLTWSGSSDSMSTCLPSWRRWQTKRQKRNDKKTRKKLPKGRRCTNWFDE